MKFQDFLESSILDSTADNGIFCTVSILDFFFIQLGKCFLPAGIQISGLGNAILEIL